MNLSQAYEPHQDDDVITNPYYYQPPEFFVNKEYDPFKADVWSLGITIYVIVTGKHPFMEIKQTMKDTIDQKKIDYDAISDVKLQLFLRRLLKNAEERPCLIEVLSDRYLARMPLIKKTPVIAPGTINIRTSKSDTNGVVLKIKEVAQPLSLSKPMNFTNINLLNPN